MGNGFNFTFVKHKGGFDQCLSISGRAGVNDSGAVRQQLINLFDGADGSSEGTAVIITVKRIQQCSVFCHQRHFCSGGTGIDSQKTITFIVF